MRSLRNVLRFGVAGLPGAVGTKLDGFAVRHLKRHGAAIGRGDLLASEDAIPLKYLTPNSVNRGDEDLANQRFDDGGEIAHNQLHAHARGKICEKRLYRFIADNAENTASYNWRKFIA
ncbi:hypothetical protein M1D96_05895 [Pseudomonas sp. D1-3]|uniref:hypothetical protein n=1 Tax=Phytopseudomonas argentinensis TaxID=289370 RepID=UPI00147C4153|nr:hypothetical protein [Pseudomonas argentinensis]